MLTRLPEDQITTHLKVRRYTSGKNACVEILDLRTGRKHRLRREINRFWSQHQCWKMLERGLRYSIDGYPTHRRLPHGPSQIDQLPKHTRGLE